MLTIIKTFLGGTWAYIVAAGAALAALFVALAGARKAGKDAVKAEAAEKEIANATTASKVTQDVARTSTDDVSKRLRDKWSRD